MSPPVAANQTSLLHGAASHGCEKGVRFILATGNFEVDARDAGGFTPFALAAIYGHVGVMSALLEAGADPHQDFSITEIFTLNLRWLYVDYRFLWPSVVQTTAALLACFVGNLAMLELMLRSGVSPDVSFRDCTLLMAAAASRSKEAKHLVSLLLQHGAKTDAVYVFSRTIALHWACLREDSDVARLLLQANEGASVNVRELFGRTPLHLACQRSVCPGLVELLLEFKADVDAKVSAFLTPLLFAVASNGIDAPAIAELLVSRGGADINAESPRNGTALNWATLRGHVQMARKLLDLGATPDGPLVTACYHLHLEVAELLLDAGADVNFCSLDDTPITATVISFSVSGIDDGKVMRLLQLLVARGADVNRKNRLGRTPLRAACQGGPLPNWLKVISFLLESGAEVSLADENGHTPLHFLQQRFHPRHGEEEHVREAARLLLEAGADSEATNNIGLVPFLQAVTCGHVGEQVGHHGQEEEERDGEIMQQLFEEKKDFLPDYESD